MSVVTTLNFAALNVGDLPKRASDRQQRTLGRQQSDDECAARQAAAKTRTADVAATGYPPSDEGRRISTVGRDHAVIETPSSLACTGCAQKNAASEDCRYRPTLLVSGVLTYTLCSVACFPSSFLRIWNEINVLHCCLSLANREHSANVLFVQSVTSSVHLSFGFPRFLFPSILPLVFRCTNFWL